MDIHEALNNIKTVTSELADEEIGCIRSFKDEAIPVLLEYVRMATTPKRDHDSEDSHLYAIYLLAEFRVYDAFPNLIKFLEIDHIRTDNLLGDILTENFASILASVTNVDDLPRIKSVIENSNLGTYNRAAALDALKVLYTEDALGRDEYVSYTHYLLDTIHGDPEMMACIIDNCVDLGFWELRQKIKKLYRAGRVNTQSISLNEVKSDMIDGDEAIVKKELKRNSHNLFINDTIKSIGWLSIFKDKTDAGIQSIPRGFVKTKEQDNPKTSLDELIRYVRDCAMPMGKNSKISSINIIKSFKDEAQNNLVKGDIKFCNWIFSKGMSGRQAVAAVLDYADKGLNLNGQNMTTSLYKKIFLMNFVSLTNGLLLSYSPPGGAHIKIPDVFFSSPPLDVGTAVIVIPHHDIVIRVSQVADEAWYGSRRDKTGALTNITIFKRKQNWKILYNGHFIEKYYPRFSISCAAANDCPAYQESFLKYHTARGDSAALSAECKMGPNRSNICPYETEVTKIYGLGLRGYLALASMCFDRWRKRPMRGGTKKAGSYNEKGVAFIINTPQWEHVSEGFREVQLREYPDFVVKRQLKGWSVDNRTSPCEHERRGHIRTLKDGRKVLVRASIVNKGGEKVVYRIGK